MTALPSDIPRFTNDGVLLTASNASIKNLDPTAIDQASSERELFLDSQAHGQIVLSELFGFISPAGRIHEGVEIETSLDLGGTVPLWPKAPQALVVDVSRRIDQATVIRAYSFDMGSDRFALELVGIQPAAAGAGNPTYDSTAVTMDSTGYTSDRTG